MSDTVTTTIRIKRGLKEALESQAKQDNRKFNGLVNIILENSQNMGTKAKDDLRDVISVISKISAELCTYSISPFLEDWKLPKSTPKEVGRKIVEQAHKFNDENIRRSRELSEQLEKLRKLTRE